MDGSPQRGLLHATTLWHFDAAEWAPSTASLADISARLATFVAHVVSPKLRNHSLEGIKILSASFRCFLLRSVNCEEVGGLVNHCMTLIRWNVMRISKRQGRAENFHTARFIGIMTANRNGLLLHFAARTELVNVNVTVIRKEFDQIVIFRVRGIPSLAPSFIG